MGVEISVADPSLFSFSHIRSSPPPHLIIDNLSIDPSIRTDSSIPPDFRLVAVSSSHDIRYSTTIFRPRVPVYMAAFNVRTPKQAGQQAALAFTLDSFGFYVCCLSETRIQDATIVTELTTHSVSYRFW